jgi:hypothetical protein
MPHPEGFGGAKNIPYIEGRTQVFQKKIDGQHTTRSGIEKLCSGDPQIPVRQGCSKFCQNNSADYPAFSAKVRRQGARQAKTGFSQPLFQLYRPFPYGVRRIETYEGFAQSRQIIAVHRSGCPYLGLKAAKKLSSLSQTVFRRQSRQLSQGDHRTSFSRFRSSS